MMKQTIADAVVTKDGDLFFISDRSGDVPAEGEHGLGLYHKDCRYLSGYELTVGGARPTSLDADGSRGFAAGFALTNPKLGPLRAQRIAIERERVIEADQRALHEVLTFQSFAEGPIDLTITLTLRAEFEDIFTVRGVRPPPPSDKRRTFSSEAARVTFSREGIDGITRSTEVCFSPAPTSMSASTARWEITLRPRSSERLLVAVRVAEAAPGERPRAEPFPDLSTVCAELHRSTSAWLDERTSVKSGSRALDAALLRALLDLRMLRERREDDTFFSAGIPWYAALFGRDSLLAALTALAFERRVAADTLRLLARHQGDKDDPHRDEEPGKILHEYRVGELARAGAIPFAPYYGTVDATLLFLVLLARHAAFTGKLDLFRELEPSVRRALAWAEANLDRTGYITYEARAAHGLDNQGWKDSEDAIVHADGSLASPPIALAEVQGYAYLAFTSIADLLARTGDQTTAARLAARAADLRDRFDRDFWMEGEGCFALARCAGGRLADVVSSNAGQVLWSGIASPEKAARTAARLMREDMWSGWGVRTLSERALRYNPLGYHLGTVWPHDNALIAAGLKRYGHDREALQIATGILALTDHFPGRRLPELISGFGRDRFARPIRYPVACHPQAWAAASVAQVVETMLGLHPEALDGRLRIVRPTLPDEALPLVIEGLAVGEARLDLRFSRSPSGGVAVEVLRREGDLTVVIEGAEGSAG